MNILVTVGSSPFESLIKAVDLQLSNTEFTLTCQIATGTYQPRAHSFLRFSDQFPRLIEQADVVITHGGAATVFELLEIVKQTGKKVLLVPNLDRIDQHQQDLAHFVERNHYAGVCWSLERLSASVRECIGQTFKPYQKDSFFMADDILTYFGISSIST